MRGLCAGAVLALTTGAAGAQADEYPQEFFIGQYRMIGVDATGPVDGRLRLEAEGAGLAVRTCGGTEGEALLPPSVTGDEHYYTGRIGGREIVCEVFGTYDNYPFLACAGDGGSRLSLWPADNFGDPLTCTE